MRKDLVQDILPLVEKPSRYLGTETNTIKKNFDKVEVKMCLAFPDLYEIGTSHFGLQILYHILNQHGQISAERVFAPAKDMESQLRKTKTPLFSLESRTPLQKMDIIGFSLLYELNYTNILTILELSGIPFLAGERDESYPLLIAGGPCMCNPEPVADFFDAVVVGDGEVVIIQMAEAWIEWNTSPKRDKQVLLQNWSRIEGVYIPSFFQATVDSSGFQSVRSVYSEYIGVNRTIIGDLENALFPDKPVIPYGRPIHDRLRLEVARGCTRGCRFCQAGMIYRPVRERSASTLLSIAEKAISETGYEDISLLSLSTGDYTCLSLLMQELMAKYSSKHIAISLPSLRAGTLTTELMNLIKKVRKTGFTIAPEAGTQRLRDVINKNLTENDIFETVSLAFEMGWQIIKLYFMTGLPTETEEDLTGITDLVWRLKKEKAGTRRFRKINVSVTTFIPKPNTPFQWTGQISLAESKENIQKLKKRLKLPAGFFKWQNPEASLLEGLFARGDRSLSSLLVAAYKKGCRFDGWTDFFNFKLWSEAIEEVGVDVDFYTTRRRDINEPLPWDHIQSGISKEYFKGEWEKALQGKTTGDCRTGKCNQCGVCDFKKVEPKIYTLENQRDMRISPFLEESECDPTVYKITYTKKKQARYFGHLEFVSIILRAIRRAGIAVRYSGGYHPKPKIAFNDPLPLGIESNREFFTVTANRAQNPEDIINNLNRQLPEGITILDCTAITSPKQSEPKGETCFEVFLKQGCFDQNKITEFFASKTILLERRNRKGKLKKIDLKYMIKKLHLSDPSRLELIILSDTGKTLRPFEVLVEIFALSEKEARQAQIVKTG
ncbi:MAG: TIGR03960 family B12-binding radical SAM protein [Desulfobacterales bacterium]